MKKINKRFLAFGAAVATLGLVVAGCSGPETDDSKGKDDATGQAAATNSVTFGWNQPAYSWNYESGSGHNSTNHLIMYLTKGLWYYYNPALEHVKNTDFGEKKLVKEDPTTVAYTIAKDAKWSDGTDVSGADLLLSWAAQSMAFNTIEADKAEDAEGNLVVPEDQVYFNAGDPNVAIIEKTPTISEDGKEFTVEYSKVFSDWEYNWDEVPLPAHVVGKRALGISDNAEAAAAVVKAIQDKDNAALAKISRVWNLDFDITEMPKGQDAELVLSCGPFMVKDFNAEQLVLERNPEFTWGKKPKVDEIVIRYNEDPMAQVQALQNGELDIIQPQVTPDVLQTVQGMENVDHQSGYEGTYEHIDLTFDNGGPFDPATYGGDAEKAKKVRQAFLKVIPRQEILEKLIHPLQPEAKVRDSFNLIPGSPYYDQTIKGNGSADYAEVDIEGAKALLAEVGVTDLKVGLLYAKSNERRIQEFQLIHASAEKAGITVEDLGNEKWSEVLGSGTYDAALFGWQNTSTSHSEPAANYVDGGQNNYGHYKNEKMAEWYGQIQSEFDAEKIAKINLEVEKALWADAFGITIFQFPSVLAWNKDVKNVSMTSIAGTSIWNFWEWERG